MTFSREKQKHRDGKRKRQIFVSERNDPILGILGQATGAFLSLWLMQLTIEPYDLVIKLDLVSWAELGWIGIGLMLTAMFPSSPLATCLASLLVLQND